MSMVHAGQHDAAPGSADTTAAPLRSLPLWARVAIERLEACTELRNQAMLDELLTGYARTYGAAVPPEIRSAVRQICQLRFRESYLSAPTPPSGRGEARPTPVPASASAAARLSQSLLKHAEPLVALSTRHLSPATLQRLADGRLSVLAYPNDYGGFVYVGEPHGSVPQEPELQTIVTLAQQAGLVWLKFDADAAEVDGLPTYAYDETSG